MGNTKERFYIDGFIFNHTQYDCNNDEYHCYTIYGCKEYKRKLMKSKKQPPILSPSVTVANLI